MRRLVFAVCFLTALALLPPASAAPPRIEAMGALDPSLTQERWSPVLVTVTNPDDGEAIQGAVQVALEDPRRGGEPIATYTRAIALPAGASRAQTMVYVQVPEGVQPDLVVAVLSEGQVVRRTRFDKLTALPEQLTVLAVSEAPDALAYLRGRSLGVFRRDGALRPLAANARPLDPRMRNNNAAIPSDAPVRVSPVSPSVLPDKALGYDAVAVVYLGDIAPEALSDTQIAALRGWAASGGLIVVGGPRLAGDDRFRAWLPARWGAPRPEGFAPLAARYAPSAGLPALPVTVTPLTRAANARPLRDEATAALGLQQDWGRGTVVALGFDAASTAFAGWPGAEAFWKDVAKSGIAARSVGRAIESDDNRWARSQFPSAVLRAPNLRAPSFGSIGLFLLIYLLLLVPINYAVLKRLDRREWTWITVPLLVIVFSVGAYGFGYSIKGGSMRLNTVTIVELKAGDGRGAVTGSIGIFSPRRASYDVALTDADALLSGPDLWDRMRERTAPLVVRQDSGAAALDADIAMWAMRVFSARTTAEMGRGVDVTLTRQGDTVVCRVTNRTDRTLNDARLLMAGWGQNLGNLAPGRTFEVRSARPLPNNRRRNNRPVNLWMHFNDGNIGGGWNGGARREDTRQAIRWNVQTAVAQAMANRSEGVGQAVVTGWNYDPLLPVTVDGKTVGAGDHVNLFVVHAALQ